MFINFKALNILKTLNHIKVLFGFYQSLQNFSHIFPNNFSIFKYLFSSIFSLNNNFNMVTGEIYRQRTACALDLNNKS